MNQKALFTIALAVSLAACSGGGGYEGGSDGPTRTTLYSASVVDTFGNSSDGPNGLRMSSAGNPGQFELAWDAEAPTSYYVAAWYLSAREDLSGDFEILFARDCERNSGSSCSQGLEAKEYCEYRQDVSIYCDPDPVGNDESAYSPTSVGPFFSQNGGLPATYFLILKVCDSTLTDCTSRSFPVLFE